MRKLIAYIGAFINFQLGRFILWLMGDGLWNNNRVSQYYLHFMHAASDWQDWGEINYPWKENKND